MNREDQILEWIRTGLQRYSQELAGYKIILFGSRARRNHREKSDFDLGIYGREPVSLQTFYKISDFLESLPTLYRIDWVDLNRAVDKLTENALKNAVVLYG
jgi:predicted nucleotidyltransferase